MLRNSQSRPADVANCFHCMDLFPVPDYQRRASAFIATMLFEMTLITKQFTSQARATLASMLRPTASRAPYNPRMFSADNGQAASVGGPVLTSQKSLQF